MPKKATEEFLKKEVEFMRQKNFLVALSVMGIFVIYFGLDSLNPSSVNLSAEKNISPLERDTVEILEKIKDKTQKKYNIGTYKINSNEINIEIKGSQEYYDSVKNEVKEVVKNTTKSTAFEKYSINVNKSEINPLISEEQREEHLLIHEISTTINDYLSESYPNQIDQVSLDNTTLELYIEIKTLLNEKQKSSGVGKEIENKILEKKLLLIKLSKEKSIKIYIYNKNGEKIN